jgi:pyruvate,orthophosphate dikinase
MKKYVYSFGAKTDGDGKMRDILGGKGAGLAEMCKAEIPCPPGFTVSTEVCNIYFENKNTVPQEIEDQMAAALARLEKRAGKKLGDAKDPLLLSVRSGAKFSMPGMMNTILNLGMNDQLGGRDGGQDGQRAVCLRLLSHWSHRRCSAKSLLQIHMEKFNHIFDAQKAKRKVKLDTGRERGRFEAGGGRR